MSVDARETNVEIPLLLQLEYSLERWGRDSGDELAGLQGNVARPPKSKRRLDVYRAIRAAGEVCQLTMPQIASLAGCSVRETQIATKDLVWLGWVDKLTDVAHRGGMVERIGSRVVRAGNCYQVSRPDWAWNGKHHKHLGAMLAKLPPSAGVHSMHPYQAWADSQKPCAPTKTDRRGAQHAPLQGCTDENRSLSLSKGQSIPKDQNQERATVRKVCTPRLEWSTEAKPFSELWEKRYKKPLFPSKGNLDRWAQLVEITGSVKSALETASAFLARDSERLQKSRHALPILLAFPDEYIPSKPIFENPTQPVLRPALNPAPSLFERLAEMVIPTKNTPSPEQA